MKTMSRALCTVAVSCAGLLLAVPARGAVTDADKSFLVLAAQSDVNEIAMSKLAETKATNPQTKAFAHKMVADHTALMAKMKPFALSWGVTAPMDPDVEHKAEIDKLNGMAGSDFDNEYLHGMDVDHHKAMDAFSAEASSTTDAKFKAVVLQGKRMVAAHIGMIDSINAKMSWVRPVVLWGTSRATQA